MSIIVGLLKDFLRPSSVSAILALFAVGIVLLYGRRTSVWGRRWLTTVILGYWVLSIPAGAWLLTRPGAASYGPIQTREQAAGAQAIVMLGGGIKTHVADGMALDDLGPSAYRLFETVRLYRLLGEPLVIVSGGNTLKLDPPRPEAAAYREGAIRLGIPPDRILVEDRSLTTREEAVILKPLLAARGITKFVLVTSPTHMGRSLATFRAVGLDPIGSASPLWNDDDVSYWSPVPGRDWLLMSDTAIYDYAAALYYWSRGWLTH